MNNAIIQTIEDIHNAIKSIDKERENLLKEKESLVTSVEVLYKVNNICPACDGQGYLYRKFSGDDPYERSSDLREDCVRCNGTGKYVVK